MKEITPPKKSSMYYLIYAVRSKGIKVDTQNRTIFYPYGDESKMNDLRIEKLCKIYGFARQAEMFVAND